MNIHLYLTLIIMLVVYSLANYYIALRGRQALHMETTSRYGIWYTLIISILALIYPLGRLGEIFFPSSFIDNMILVGSFWMGMLYYLCIFTLFIDTLYTIDKKKNFLPNKLKQHSRTLALTIFLVTIGLISYGAWNARHPITQNYEITIPKKEGSLETLQVVMVSDIHLGKIIDNRRLTKIVNRINQLEPDIVLLAGDIIDSKVDVLLDQRMIENFSRLRPRLGTYAILGNHEYFEQQPDLAIQYLEQGNIHVLRDQWSFIANSFYLVGRDDLAKHRYTGVNRQTLSNIMMGINPTFPIILLDHQPHSLPESVEQGIDLQLSGHTHLGQIYPNNLITKKIYELDWGYLRKENLQAIVSCGLGTWGPPIRIGNQPEFVNITIHFTKESNDL